MSVISNILFPGRHHLLTNFQFKYLKSVIDKRGNKIADLHAEQYRLAEKLNIIWAVTSANHSGTRRNPLPSSKREAAIEQFGASLNADSFVFPINDLGTTERFADHLIKDIEVQSRGSIQMNPANTLVACSTPTVIELFQTLGYGILPVELVDDTGKASHLRPWDLVMKIVEAKKNWRLDPIYLEQVHPESRKLLEKYNFGDYIVELHDDPLLGDEGDITETRDYNTYARAFDDGADRKYDLIRHHVQPGRIVDIGCATGAVIRKLSEDDRLRESDIYGIEVARKLYEICQHRNANGEFKNENVFFYQRNIARGKIFPNNSIQTTLTFSLTHEIESYIGRGALMKFLERIYDQTAFGGVYINVDVVGPTNGGEQVYAKLNTDDGKKRDDSRWEKAKSDNKTGEYVSSLSTFERFLQFALDFRPGDVDHKINYEIEEIRGTPYIKTSLTNISEYLSKKDYTDNWLSEMHETFCFWSFDDWKKALNKVGFRLSNESKSYLNSWIVKNRFLGKAELYKMIGKKLTKIPFPPTNTILIAEKI